MAAPGQDCAFEAALGSGPSIEQLGPIKDRGSQIPKAWKATVSCIG